MENMVIVCLDVSEQLIIRIFTQLNEAGKALTQISSAYALFGDPLATSFAAFVQKSEPVGRQLRKLVIYDVFVCTAHETIHAQQIVSGCNPVGQKLT